MTIAVPKRAEYESAGTVFDDMATGLLSAADLTRRVDFLPGTFPEAEALQEAVDAFCQERQATLEIYAEACRYIGEILRVCGEAYSGTENSMVEKGSALEGKLTSAVQGMQRLHTRLDDLHKGSTRRMRVDSITHLPPDVSITGLGPAVTSSSRDVLDHFGPKVATPYPPGQVPGPSGVRPQETVTGPVETVA